jgi:hypothetical protein
MIEAIWYGISMMSRHHDKWHLKHAGTNEQCPYCGLKANEPRRSQTVAEWRARWPSVDSDPFSSRTSNEI